MNNSIEADTPEARYIAAIDERRRIQEKFPIIDRILRFADNLPKERSSHILSRVLNLWSQLEMRECDTLVRQKEAASMLTPPNLTINKRFDRLDNLREFPLSKYQLT